VRRAAQTTGLQPSAAEALEVRRDALPVERRSGSMERLVGRTRASHRRLRTRAEKDANSRASSSGTFRPFQQVRFMSAKEATGGA